MKYTITPFLYPNTSNLYSDLFTLTDNTDLCPILKVVIFNISDHIFIWIQSYIAPRQVNQYPF